MNKEELYALSERLIKRAKNTVVDNFKKRELYKLIDENDSSIIIGPRRIGKTTLLEAILRKYTETFYVTFSGKKVTPLENTMNSLKDDLKFEDQGFLVQDPKKVLYLKLDSLEFVSMNQKELESLQLEIRNIVLDDGVDFLLLDEIQTLPNWTHLVKDIKDLSTKEVRVVGTGSNSNELMKGAEHGTGRYGIKFYGVLTLKEYVDIKCIDSLSDQSYREYIEFDHFPHYNEERYRDEVSSAIIEKAFGSSEKNKTNIFKVLKWINKNPGSEINLQKIANQLEISRQYIDGYLSALQDGQLIFKLPNRLSKTAKRKVYSLIPGAFTLFDGRSASDFDETEKGQHFENFAFIQLLSMSHSIKDRMGWEYIRVKGDHHPSEIDFVHGDVGFEVKLSIPSDYKKYIAFAKDKGLKTIYFIFKDGEKPSSWEHDGLDVRFFKWDDFAKDDNLKMLKGDLNID